MTMLPRPEDDRHVFHWALMARS